MAEGPETMRLDRFLWWVRLARTRQAARAIAADGHLRIDGRPVARAHVAVRVGQVLTFICNGEVRVVRVDALPGRRGPASEACGCYSDPTTSSHPGEGRACAGVATGANVSHQIPGD